MEIPGSRNNELMDIFRDSGFTKGVEIGAEAGVFSENMCLKIPNLTLYCVDPWKVYPEYRGFIDQKALDGFYKETVKRLKPYGARIIRDFSENAYKEFTDGSLDFVFIDGNHDFAHVTSDIANWLPKIRAGGVMSGHDFHYKARNEKNQVEDAVMAFTEKGHIKPWFVLKKPKGSPTWFWVKT